MGATLITFTFTFILPLFLLIAIVDSSMAPPCGKTCAAINFNTVGIKYGQYCGVGYSGCRGEKPCDDLDTCCRMHDDCVGKHGMVNIKCHGKLKQCGQKVQKSKKFGFSRVCPYEVAVPTVLQGLDWAISMSRLVAR